MKTIPLMDLMYAITHDERFSGDVMASDVLHVIEIATLKIGMHSLCAPLRLELSNGEVLVISVEGKTPEPMKFSIQELRPEVMAFALLMEARLREKDVDRKGSSWKTADADNLLVHATAKTYSIDAALSIRGDEVEAAKHAVDLANYCMMIADVAGALEAPELERKTDNGGAGWVGLDQSRAEPLEIPSFLRKNKD